MSSVDHPREQSHALIARRCSGQRGHPERSEISRFEQFGADRPAAVGGVGGVERGSSGVVELDEAGVLDAVGLGVGDRKDDPFAQFFVRPEDHLDIVAIVSRRPTSIFWDRRETRGRIDGHAAVRGYGTGPERQR